MKVESRCICDLSYPRVLAIAYVRSDMAEVDLDCSRRYVRVVTREDVSGVFVLTRRYSDSRVSGLFLSGKTFRSVRRNGV